MRTSLDSNVKLADKGHFSGDRPSLKFEVPLKRDFDALPQDIPVKNGALTQIEKRHPLSEILSRPMHPSPHCVQRLVHFREKQNVVLPKPIMCAEKH